MRPLKIIILVAFLTAVSTCIVVYANGKGLVTNKYSCSYEDEDASFSLKLRTHINPIQFLLHRVTNKYKLVRIEVRYWSKKRTELSTKKDKIEFHFKNGQKISGILDLAEHDPHYWDSLDSTLRDELAYPKSIVPLREKDTVISVFLSARKIEALRGSEEELDISPTLIKYTIASLGPEVFTIKRVVIKAGR